MIKWYVCI